MTDTTTPDTNDQADTTATEDTGSLFDTVTDEPAPIDFSKGRPETFPEELWDSEKNAPKIDAVYNKWKEAETKAQEAENRAKGLRDKLAKGENKAPKSVDEYTFTPSEKAKEFIPDDDPVVKAARDVALEFGMSKGQFEGFMGKMADVVAGLREEAMNAAPPELTPEQKAEARQAEYAKIGANAPQVINAVKAWGNELKANGLFNDDDMKAFYSMATTGEQVRALNKMRSLYGAGKEIPMEFAGDGMPTRDEIADMIVKAYRTRDPKEIAKAEEIQAKAIEAGVM